jgi:hypothetical protein
MDNKTFSFIIIFIFFSNLVTSCRHGSEIPALPDVSFNRDVQPILSANCAQSGCHGNIDKRRFSLLTYEEVMSSNTVISGDAHNSNLYKAITGRNNIMPKAPQSPLSDSQIRYIFIWIGQGAKNN